MKARRKIIVYIATSADGYIARPDGDVEWLNRRPRTVDYGMRAFYPSIDTILRGRKTYDWGSCLFQEERYERQDVRQETRQLSVHLMFSRT
jgi:dihydrofolate reductase